MPGEKTLIVANSDPVKAVWYAFDLFEMILWGMRALFMMDGRMQKTKKGNPDGLAVDSDVNVFATGPGGV
jgi:gluconolactonase